jgi:hypothetical protein
MDIKQKKELIRPTEELAQKAIASGEEWCTPKDVSLVAEYALDIRTSHERYDGVFWDAILYKGDRPILWVENDGNGGCNSYHPVPGAEYSDRHEWHTLLREFEEASRKALPDNQFEQHDHICSFLDLIANAI